MSKYQEALNRIVENNCPKKTNCQSCEISNRCNSLMKDEVDKLQHLIDCQLTPGERKTVINCLASACFERNQYNTIFNKLKNQKELWEEE